MLLLSSFAILNPIHLGKNVFLKLFRGLFLHYYSGYHQETWSLLKSFIYKCLRNICITSIPGGTEVVVSYSFFKVSFLCLFLQNNLRGNSLHPMLKLSPSKYFFSLSILIEKWTIRTGREWSSSNYLKLLLYLLFPTKCRIAIFRGCKLFFPCMDF